MEEKEITEVVNLKQAALYVNKEELVVSEHLDWLIKQTNKNIELFYLGGFSQVVEDFSILQSEKVHFVLTHVIQFNTPTLRKYIQKCNQSGWRVQIGQRFGSRPHEIDIVLDKSSFSL